MTDPGGRTPQMPIKRDEILKLARAGVPQTVIAEAVKIHPATLSKWLKWGDPTWDASGDQECPPDREPYREFRDEFREAQAQPVVICEATWMQAVRGKPAVPEDKESGTPAQPAVPPDPKAAERWLKTHRPDLYRETIDVEIGGDLGKAAKAWANDIRELINRHAAPDGAIER